ncbi:hypothetical protein DPEC_G00051550 [Dallia pectoralis]|uniref:Uncharacterized protein n=1 Tax=Dallia pectoralis TaxID=75939 RepID=A0ACC2HB98_DALPE|nr:hypothetical protein DPEC_G00051550 [Dallia pectoralis]
MFWRDIPTSIYSRLVDRGDTEEFTVVPTDSSMPRLCVSMLVYLILHGFLCFTGAEDSTNEVKDREKREMPNWAMWSSDFTGWLQELTSQAYYDQIQNLARTYWAHFPIASYLGYDSPDENPDVPEEVPE